MPLFLFDEPISANARLTLWKNEEGLQALMDIADRDAIGVAEVNSIFLEKRKREWLCTRIMLAHINPALKLSFMSNGKPVLSHEKHISISHCENIAGIVLSGSSIGMDIQSPDARLRRLFHKFCNEAEENNFPPDVHLTDHLTMIWSAKEAIFKYFGEHVLFAEDITILPFQIDEGKLRAIYKGIHGEKEFLLSHYRVEGFHIVIAN